MHTFIVEGHIIEAGSIKKLDNNKGFTQYLRLHLPAEEIRGRKLTEEFFTISIYSNSETDSRFMQPEIAKKFVAQKYYAKAKVRMKGERWHDGRQMQYSHKLNLEQWVP